MLSSKQELRPATPRPLSVAPREVSAGPFEAVDEAFATADQNDWRHDEPHAQKDEDLAVEVQAQLAALAAQSRELTTLLGKLDSTRQG